MKCRQKGASIVRYVNPGQTSIETQSTFVPDRVTIVLEEIDHTTAPQQDETPEVVVEYTNLKSYRVSLDEFVREVDSKRENDGFREEFKVWVKLYLANSSEYITFWLFFCVLSALFVRTY